MSSKNLTVFVTTYEKVLSILNKVKEFIKNNTKEYQDIINELDWVSDVIINKSLYNYEINKDKLASDNQKFLDFITKYNEEIINLNKKHVLVRDIISMVKNRDMLQKPSLILKKISSKELTQLTYKENEENEKKEQSANPLGKWVMNLYIKNQRDNIDSEINNNLEFEKINKSSDKKTPNKEINTDNKSLSSIKNKKKINNVMHNSSSLTYIHKNSNDISLANKIKKLEHKNEHENNTSNLRNKILNLARIKKAMERYYLTVMEEKDKKENNKKTFQKKLITHNKFKPNNLIIKKTIPDNLNTLIEKHFDYMKTITEEDFNLFKLKKKVGHKNVLPLMCHTMFKILGLIDHKIITVKKLPNFLISMSQGYHETTLYHNSLHGADVCHSLFLYITNSNIEEICQTTILDLLGLVISATGHDLGHPGFNNNFHVNSSSDLALTYNDISCLENYHASTLFRILRKEENNIFELMEIDNYKNIRKRIINQILATDMVNHAMVLSRIKAKISLWNSDIIDKNKKFVFLSGEEKTKFDEQQMMLNYLIHTADLGHNTKKFEISIQWVELLTKEFWIQGDTERKNNLNISFLCDRNNVDVPQSQVGFINGFILSTFSLLVTMFPTLEFTLVNAKNNIKKWQELAEQKRKRGWTPQKVIDSNEKNNKQK